MSALYMHYQCTEKQIEYMQYIVEYAKDHNGNSPGLRAIARHFDVSYSTARGHISELAMRRLLCLVDGSIVVEEAVWEPPPHIDG